MSLLVESGLNRINDLMENHSCAIISAYRGSRTRKGNREVNLSLLSKIKQKGYSITQITGAYLEVPDPDAEDAPVTRIRPEDVDYERDFTGEPIDDFSLPRASDLKTKQIYKVVTPIPPGMEEVRERSLFVANLKVDGDDGGELEKFLIPLAVEFDQDSVLSLRVGQKAQIIGTTDRENAYPEFGQRVIAGKRTLGSAAGWYYSYVKDRIFAFESIEKVYRAPTGRGRWAELVMAERPSDKIYYG